MSFCFWNNEHEHLHSNIFDVLQYLQLFYILMLWWSLWLSSLAITQEGLVIFFSIQYNKIFWDHLVHFMLQIWNQHFSKDPFFLTVEKALRHQNLITVYLLLLAYLWFLDSFGRARKEFFKIKYILFIFH